MGAWLIDAGGGLAVCQEDEVVVLCWWGHVKGLVQALQPAASRARTGSDASGSGGVLPVPVWSQRSQNHRMVRVGRDLCGSPSPTPCRSRVTYSRL